MFMNNDGKKYFGKYRGTVTNSEPSASLGRAAMPGSIAVDVPNLCREVYAMPCVPYAGNYNPENNERGTKEGFYAIPSVGTGVWVEFEMGDINCPIWSGCFWHEGGLPENAEPNRKIFKTKHGKLEIRDEDGETSLTLELTSGSTTLTVVMDKDGISLDNGQNATVKLNGTSVSLNNGGLEVLN